MKQNLFGDRNEIFVLLKQHRNLSVYLKVGREGLAASPLQQMKE
ncbi:hypothetical protein HMPREF1981_00284 [Bacteroides pyogenes F0041]|uniref:Uncharacterized protein n=1 Tax=Bacteroides pyogenes F0041 TaxID=1321819 RepID=U2E3T1_9BACE|nr:hypothetical protein HMPREF1981_00284 [Bacteroides pyogenes F0041]